MINKRLFMPYQQDDDKMQQGLLSTISKLILVIVVLVVALIAMPFIIEYSNQPDKPKEKISGASVINDAVKKDAVAYWTAPDVNSITDAKQKEQVEYGKELIAHTSKYLGPNGSVLKISNGMNCQNCHYRQVLPCLLTTMAQ